MSITLPPVAEVRNPSQQAYPAYKDSGVPWLGKLPTHWHLRRIKFLAASVTSGSRGWAQYYSDSGSLFLRIANLSRNSIGLDLEERRYVSPPASAEGMRTRVLKHDILISITAYIGSVGIVDEDLGEAYVSQHIALVRPRASHVLPRWLAYYLLAQPGQEQFSQSLYGGTKDGLGLDDVRNIAVLLPPRAEQEAITAFLDREILKIDALIAKKERLIALLQEKRAALISNAVTRGLDPTAPMRDSGVAWLGRVPAHWEVLRLKHCLRAIEQGWSPACENRPATEYEWGVLKVGCVNGTAFDSDENKALPADQIPLVEYEIKPGDVLMSRANTRQLLGSASLVEDVRPRLLLCDKLYRLRVRTSVLRPSYLVHALGSRVARFQFEREATGASDSMQNIAQGIVLNLVLPLPSVPDQEAIVTHIEDVTRSIDSLVARVNEHIDRLREYRAALISAAVTGQIDVREEVR